MRPGLLAGKGLDRAVYETVHRAVTSMRPGLSAGKGHRPTSSEPFGIICFNEARPLGREWTGGKAKVYGNAQVSGLQ